MMERHIGYAHKTDTEYLGKEIVESDLKHACKVCPKKFVNESILFKHNIDHDTQNHEYLRKDCYFKERKGSRYACKFCYKKSETFIGVARHILEIHRSDENMFKVCIKEEDCIHNCQRCDQKFVTKDILAYHMEFRHQVGNLNSMGKPSNTCKLCYKKFKHSKGMKTHILLAHKADQEFIGREIQDSELKYACNLCPRKFVKETILLKHNLGHEAQNHEYLRADCFFKDRKGCRYVCKLCYRKLSTFESLVGHILKNHGSHEKFFRISIKQQDCIYPCKR